MTREILRLISFAQDDKKAVTPSEVELQSSAEVSGGVHSLIGTPRALKIADVCKMLKIFPISEKNIQKAIDKSKKMVYNGVKMKDGRSCFGIFDDFRPILRI